MSGQDTSAKIAKRSGRGSKPGERRGGRQKGTPNKATASLRDVARQYTEQAIETLVNIALSGESEAARVSAANAILDRGYGKPSQVVQGDEDGCPLRTVNDIIMRGVRPS